MRCSRHCQTRVSAITKPSRKPLREHLAEVKTSTGAWLPVKLHRWTWILLGSSVWFTVCHRASREWSEYLLFWACSTSVSGHTHLTELCTPQLQTDPSLEKLHTTFSSGLSFCAKQLTRSETLWAAPCSPHPAVGMASPRNKRLLLVPGKPFSPWNLSCLLQKQGAGQMGISCGTPRAVCGLLAG